MPRIIFPIDRHLANRIRAEREKAGLRLADVAKKAGVSPVMIHKYECGLTPIAPERLALIAAALDRPVEFFTAPGGAK